ncbi:MAG TPA: hypothetical protein QGF05_02665 [Dehalococcoidia bacterium]|nr:hypothetical protein [Dehalococcoidia bacterium]
MSKEARCFQEIVMELDAAHADVQIGKMMSSEALTVKGKVFCFFWERRNAMVFKLGKEAETERAAMAGWEWLNPFKNKGPMKAWYAVPLARKRAWKSLAEEALEMGRSAK